MAAIGAGMGVTGATGMDTGAMGACIGAVLATGVMMIAAGAGGMATAFGFVIECISWQRF